MVDVWPYVFRVIQWTKIKQDGAWDKKKCVKLVVIKQRMRLCRIILKYINKYNIKRDLKINRVVLMTVVL